MSKSQSGDSSGKGQWPPAEEENVHNLIGKKEQTMPRWGMAKQEARG